MTTLGVVWFSVDAWLASWFWTTASTDTISTSAESCNCASLSMEHLSGSVMLMVGVELEVNELRNGK